MIRRSQDYLAAMPNLSLTGLSENWLLKECGHQHWLALAHLFDLPLPDFREADGRSAYAAFVAIRVTQAQLQRISEHQPFSLHTTLEAAGRARFVSQHQLCVGEERLASVELISTLVTRQEQGNNQSACRSGLFVPSVELINPMAGRGLSELAKSFRSQQWQSLWGIEHNRQTDSGEVTFRPSPMGHFNGADFLYCAHFQSLADEAEWQLSSGQQLWQTADRLLCYYGNINLGELLRYGFRVWQQQDGQLRHWLEVTRQSDGQRIADIVTCKSALPASRYRWVGR